MQSDRVASDSPEVDYGVSSSASPGHHSLTKGQHLNYTNEKIFEPSETNNPRDIEVTPSSRGKLSKRSLALISVAAGLVILAVALGAGLGVGLRHSNTSSTPSPTASAPSATTTATVKDGILNDTSLTALVTPEGNRHLFFQSNNGSLRHIVYNSLASGWPSSADFIDATPRPRNNTPLTAMVVGGDLYAIHLFYIDINNFVSVYFYNPNGEDTSYINLSPMNQSFLAAANTRSLSISPLVTNSSTTSEAVLEYEASNGNVTTLSGTYTPISTASQWLWYDISELVSATLNGTDAWLSPPVASYSSDQIIPGANIFDQVVYLTYFNPNALYNHTASPLWWTNLLNWADLKPELNASSSSAALTSATSDDTVPNNATKFIQESDLISFNWSNPTNTKDTWSIASAYVQNQSLVFQLPQSIPDASKINTPYPFSRLAVIGNTTTNGVYIYHQLTEEILVEEEYLAAGGGQSVNITIGTST